MSWHWFTFIWNNKNKKRLFHCIVWIYSKLLSYYDKRKDLWFSCSGFTHKHRHTSNFGDVQNNEKRNKQNCCLPWMMIGSITVQKLLLKCSIHALQNTFSWWLGGKNCLLKLVKGFVIAMIFEEVERNLQKCSRWEEYSIN